MGTYQSMLQPERDIRGGVSHVTCLPHIKQTLHALINRLCEKLQSHPRDCFGVGYLQKLGSVVTMKDNCPCKYHVVSWEGSHIKSVSRPKLTEVGNIRSTEVNNFTVLYIKVM